MYKAADATWSAVQVVGDVRSIADVLSKGSRAFKSATSGADVRFAGKYQWACWNERRQEWGSPSEFQTRTRVGVIC